MTVTLDTTFLLTIGAAALGCNIVCLLLLFMRPASGSAVARSSEQLARTTRTVLAEAIGTFALVLTGVLIAAGPALGAPESPLIAVALAYGCVLMGLIAAFAPVDSGHFNPAVTLGLVIAGRCQPAVACGMLVAQCVGAAGAAYLMAWLTDSAVLLAGVPTMVVPSKAAFVLEALGTFVFVLVIAAVTARAEYRPIAPLAIGATLCALILALGPLTGAALNPARYLGPALPNASFDDALVYLAGPTCGGGIAAVFVQMFLVPTKSPLSAEDAEVAEEPRQAA